MTSDAAQPLDETDVERAIDDEIRPAIAPPSGVAAPLAGVRDEQGELDAAEVDGSEALRLALDGGGPGPEERILHLEDPVTEALDDEVDLDESTLDADQRDDVEWRISAASDAEPA